MNFEEDDNDTNLNFFEARDDLIDEYNYKCCSTGLMLAYETENNNMKFTGWRIVIYLQIY